jgi:hypothetical protein
MRRRTFIVLSALLVLFVGLLFVPIVPGREFLSPDGRFAVVLHKQPIYAFVPVMPGGGRDLPARATLYKDQKSCGSLWLEMASFIDDLSWRTDEQPHEAEIKLVGRWNLDACSVEQN